MFWILENFSSWLWWPLLITGLFGYFLAYLIPLKPYQLLLKIVGALLVVTIIFIFGLQHANNHWQQAAQELQAKVEVAEAKSQIINGVVHEKIVVQTKIVKQRGETIVKYIDREVVKMDENCVIPPEFVNAHNKAATQ